MSEEMRHVMASPAINGGGASQSTCVIFELLEVGTAYSISSRIVSPLTAETRANQEERSSPWMGRGASGSAVSWHSLPGVTAFQKWTPRFL